MSTRAEQYAAEVISREALSPHLVRVVLAVDGDFASTGAPDEWVGLIVPGQFQSRYYTVRSYVDHRLTLDIVVHETGLVTEWARRDEIVGETVTITDPKGSFEQPPGARWLMLVGDLTALPAMARIAGEAQLPTRIWAEVPDVDELADYLPGSAEVTWLAGHGDRLAATVEALEWPQGEGYFWMAGESSQMRAIRKHLMRERQLPSHAYDVMGYWRASTGRQPRAVDPGPVYRAGKAAGLSDDQIWAHYDDAQQEADQ